MSSASSYYEMASSLVPTVASRTISTSWSYLKSYLSIWVRRVVCLTWELGKDRNLYVYEVTLPQKTLKEQLRAYDEEASPEKGYKKPFKPMGGDREFIRMIDHPTSRQALEDELLGMLDRRASEEMKRGVEGPGVLRRQGIAEGLAEEVWAELKRCKS